MEKIKKILHWINSHLLEIVCIWAIISGGLPFVLEDNISHGSAFYAFLGALTGIVIAVYLIWNKRDGIKTSRFSERAMAILGLQACASLWYLILERTKIDSAQLKLSCCIYLGTVFALIITVGMVDSIREEKRKSKIEKLIQKKQKAMDDFFEYVNKTGNPDNLYKKEIETIEQEIQKLRDEK